MADHLTRLVERTLGIFPTVRPYSPPTFATRSIETASYEPPDVRPPQGTGRDTHRIGVPSRGPESGLYHEPPEGPKEDAALPRDEAPSTGEPGLYAPPSTASSDPTDGIRMALGRGAGPPPQRSIEELAQIWQPLAESGRNDELPKEPEKPRRQPASPPDEGAQTDTQVRRVTHKLHSTDGDPTGSPTLQQAPAEGASTTESQPDTGSTKRPQHSTDREAAGSAPPQQVPIGSTAGLGSQPDIESTKQRRRVPGEQQSKSRTPPVERDSQGAQGSHSSPADEKTVPHPRTAPISRLLPEQRRNPASATERPSPADLRRQSDPVAREAQDNEISEVGPPLVSPTFQTREESALDHGEPQAVRVQIGRVEVRASTPPSPPRAPAPHGFDGYELVRSYVSWNGTEAGP
jgi:hypothetical protein